MFKRKKKKTGVKTPELRKPTPPPPPPTSGSNAVKPNPNYIPPASVKKFCPYETPCGWCSKWDKECDKKIGCEDTDNPKEEFITKYLGIWVKSDNPCLECVHYGWSMPQCRECKPPRNNFKYFELKEDD